MFKDCYAHSTPGPREEWESLEAHAQAVADLAGKFAQVFGWAGAARALGLLHDAGKASAAFQAYICGDSTRRVDHSTHGARIAMELYRNELGRILAWCIAGHHAGLADGADLDGRLDPLHEIPDASSWPEHISAPAIASLRPTRTPRVVQSTVGFTQSFLVRMLFSCLVDADFLATEDFMSGGRVGRRVQVPLKTLERRLAGHMAGLQARAEQTELNRIRARIFEHVASKADDRPGFFTLTVPTGGGKTLASLSFALRHALAKEKRRVIYVIPFTSIIEQTADVFRKAIGDDAVLEHHSNFDWEDAKRSAGQDGGDERDKLGALRRAAENWDASVIVTTAVQFFESLFANRTSACRKLHNIADSVIVLDEAQTLPIGLLRPCMAVLEELTRNYGVSVVLCTATQPALRQQDAKLHDGQGRAIGMDIPDDRELAPDPPELYVKLKRTKVEIRPGEITDAEVAERFAAMPQILCIVNSRGHARALFDRIADLPGAYHLTTLMCPAHRRAVLAELRQRLKDGEPVRLVATSLIEAGVDISFPEVWRALTGLDSIAQAAGRCNREGELLPAYGHVVVFEPADAKMPRSFQAPQQAARSVLHEHENDALSLDAIRAFFGQLYFQKGIDALDDVEIDGVAGRGVLNALHVTARGLRFPFESIAQSFRFIDETMQPVVVPWNDDAKAVLRTAAVAERAPKDELRRLQQYTVGIPRAARDFWLAAKVIVPVRRDLGDALLRFEDSTHYRCRTGVDLANPTWRSIEENLF